MKLYLKYASIILKSQMQYKTSFFMSVIGQFLVSLPYIWALLHVSSFSFSERIYYLKCCYMLFSRAFSYSLAERFVRGFDVFS